jgi:hypothetical protein
MQLQTYSLEAMIAASGSPTQPFCLQQLALQLGLATSFGFLSWRFAMEALHS